MSRDSLGGIFTVAGVLCIACSLLVSAAAVGLRPLQEANKRREIQENILKAVGLFPEDGNVDEVFKENVKAIVVELPDGTLADDVDAASFDQKAAARDPKMSITIEPTEDFGGIKTRSTKAVVYLILKDKKIEQVVLPVHGKGLWSTMYGFLAIKTDKTKSISGLTFYQHGETPGLGGEVDNPAWKELWKTKAVYDDQGEVSVEVIRGTADPDNKYQVDGLAGATITSRGVTNLIKYWLGEGGFKKFLDRLPEVEKQLAAEESNG